MEIRSRLVAPRPPAPAGLRTLEDGRCAGVHRGGEVLARLALRDAHLQSRRPVAPSARLQRGTAQGAGVLFVRTRGAPDVEFLGSKRPDHPPAHRQKRKKRTKTLPQRSESLATR